MQCYQDAYAVITFSASLRQLYLKWVREPGETELLSIYEKALSFAKSTQARSLVVDNSIGFTVSLSMQHNLTALAIHYLHHLRVRRFARVTPPDVFQEIITHKVLDQINLLAKEPIEVGYFDRSEEARAWAALPCIHDEEKGATL